MIGPPPDPTWIGDEPRFSAAARRVLSRALRSRWRLLAFAGAVSAGLVGWRVLKEPRYEVSLHLRMEESEVIGPGRAPPPPRDIREHLASVALSRHQLESIMRRNHLSERWLGLDRDGAIAEFRNDIDVAVDRNYFIYDRAPDDPPRSAQVTIRYAAADLEQARAVVRDLGDVILHGESAKRSGTIASARTFLRAELDDARAARRRLEGQVVALAGRIETAGRAEAAALSGRLAGLRRDAEASLWREVSLERRAAELELGASAEQASVGMRFERVDESVEIFAPPLGALGLLLRTVLAFAAALLLGALALGTFDDRVHSRDDLEWWGLPVFGTVRRFPNDDTGSQRARTLRPRVAR